MSDVVKDQALINRTTSLRHSGAVWSDRIVDEQRPFVRQLSLLADNGNPRVELEAAGDWMLGREAVRGEHSWSFTVEDTRLLGPGQWGYIQMGSGTIPLAAPGTTVEVLPNGEDFPLVTSEGYVFVIPAGGIQLGDQITGLLVIQHDDEDCMLLIDNGFPIGIESHLHEAATVTVCRETVWFLRAPENHEPIALETARGELLEGTGFRASGGWIILRDNPWELWPDGIAHATACRWNPSCSRHRALRTDRMKTSGHHVALYKRGSQSTTHFIKAIAETAGIPVFERDGVVARIFRSTVGWVHHLTDGSRFVLPGDGGYQPGSQIHEGGIGGELVALRSRRTHGEDWWRSRLWSQTGIDISVFRPGFTGFRIRDETIPAISYEDPEGGGLRARVQFSQDPVEEDRYWAWQAATERHLGNEVFARDVLGFDAPDQMKQVNPMDVWSRMLGDWLMVIETTMQRYNPAAFLEIRDFVDREKPAGIIVAILAI